MWSDHDRSAFDGRHYLFVGSDDGLHCFECIVTYPDGMVNGLQVVAVDDDSLLAEFKDLKSPLRVLCCLWTDWSLSD